jgi:hypothetical protein
MAFCIGDCYERYKALIGGSAKIRGTAGAVKHR